MVGNECIAGVYRDSEHWIANTARGAKTRECPLDDELREISIKAAEAVGGGVLAIDIMESDKGLLVHETNYTMEYKNSIVPTGVDIPTGTGSTPWRWRGDNPDGSCHGRLGYTGGELMRPLL